MKFLVSILLIALLSLVACIYLPWWSIAIVAMLVTVLISMGPIKAFFAGFIALFFLWSILAFWISAGNEHILAHKISLTMLKMDSPVSLALITGLIGALVAGFAALAGSYLRKGR